MCIWSVEADIFDFNDSDITNLVYWNSDVEKFMKAKDSMGIAACKGMGKTFLLKAKRMLLMKDKSILTLPKDRIVDVSGTMAIKKMQIKFLSSYSNWVSIWVSCISIYLLSIDNFSNIIDEDMNELPICVRKIIKSNNIGIFSVLHKILNFQSKETLNEVVQAADLLFDYAQQIQQQVAIFVDKLEEPFNRGYFKIPGSTLSAQGNYNASIWAYAQLSFAEAVYTFYSSRHHIKIFYSIRKEALYRGEQISTEYPKLRSRIVSLKYSPSDLYKMFCLYVSQEERKDLALPDLVDKNPIKALVGIDKIEHRSGIKEDVWDYIYRHTFQRPRDIMEMCEAIHRNIVVNEEIKDNSSRRRRVLRHWVNEISSMECMSYLSFLEPFMSYEENIKFKEDILNFVRKLPINIFNIESMNYFCHLVNRNEQEIECDECAKTHYFSTLYNIGLLGYVRKSHTEKVYENKIKHIGESTYDSKHQSLPHGELYYVHPGLGNLIQREREVLMRTYTPCNFVINNLLGTLENDQVCFMRDSIQASLGNMKCNGVFITSTGRDLDSERKRVKQLLENKGYEVYAYEEPDFPQLENTLENTYEGATHDHCIKVMLRNCRHIIYIFSGRYGGRYAGSNYEYYAERETVIDEMPNISFMEYLVGKCNGKNVKVYVDEKVDVARGEYLANGKPKNYQSKVVENNKVFELLGYFNELGNGTWYDKYKDFLALERFVDAQFPVIKKK